MDLNDLETRFVQVWQQTAATSGNLRTIAATLGITRSQVRSLHMRLQIACDLPHLGAAAAKWKREHK